MKDKRGSLSYVEYEVVEKSFETAAIANFLLKPRNQQIRYQPGQFITLIFDHLAADPVRRSYSMSSTPGIDEHIQITVQKIPNGLVSRYLVDHVETGDVLHGLLPSGQFTIPEVSFEIEGQIFLIGGGSGFTPLFSLLQFVLHELPSKKVILILANSNPEKILYKSKLFQLMKKFPNRLQILFVLSRVSSVFVEGYKLKYGIRVHKGRVSNALMESWIQSYIIEKCALKTHFFVCGPNGLKIKTVPVIRMLGFDDASIFTEDFIIKEPLRPDAKDLSNARVEVHFQGQTFQFKVHAGKNILEEALVAGIELPYNCRSGICTTCTATCSSGKTVMYAQDGISDTSQTNGDVLTCVAYPLTPFVEIEVL